MSSSKLVKSLHSRGTVDIIRIRKFVRCYGDLPRCDFVPRPYNGPTYEHMVKVRRDNVNPSIKTFYKKPLALHQGYKQWLFDIEGKRYLDLFGGIVTVSVGHCHPKITDAVNEQMKTLPHVTNIYLHQKIHEYAEKLVSKFPGNLKVVYLVNSGSEANDLAFLLARLHTRNFDVMAFQNCYHGLTYQLMSLTASGGYKHRIPYPGGVHHVMNPDVYRGLWGGKNCRDSPVQTTRNCSCPPDTCTAKDQYLNQFKEHLSHTTPKNGVAAFFAESIQGVGGVVQYPKGYLKEVHRIVKENGGLFVSDEVQTGFGRTGDHFWGFEGHGFVPDIVTMAKGIGNGFPLAAVVTTPEIAASIDQASHFNTFGGNPVASAVGKTVLEIIEEEQLQENSKVVGDYFMSKLKVLRDQYPIIGDVRGKGLMIGVEFVEADGSGKPMPAETFAKIWEDCRENHVIIGKGGTSGNVMRIAPPMCITKDDVDFAMGVIERAIQKVL